MPILLPQKTRKGGVGAGPQRRDDGPAFSARVFPWRKIPPGGCGMFRRSLSCVCAGLLTATGLDFLALLADVRAPLGFALVAAFVAVLGLRGLATS